ncbi:hypothetical protein GCM10028821_36940 [Hymenobacter jeollabukensis]
MLSSYSSQALTTFLRLLPELTNFVVEQGEVFEINMQTPSGGEFWVSSAEHEITVGFEEYHTHFGWHEGTHPEQDATDAATFIQQLQSGQLRLAVWYKGDTYAGSRPIESDEELHPKNWLQHWLWRSRTVKVKSWA